MDLCPVQAVLWRQAPRHCPPRGRREECRSSEAAGLIYVPAQKKRFGTNRSPTSPRSSRASTPRAAKTLRPQLLPHPHRLITAFAANPRCPQNTLQNAGGVEKMWPSLHAHFPVSRANPHSRKTFDRHHAVGDFRLHQLHRSRKSFHRRADAQRRAGHIGGAARRAAFRIFLDVCVPAPFLRLGGGPGERELGLRRSVPALVRRDGRDRDCAHIRRAVRTALAAGDGRGGELSLLQTRSSR